MIFFATKHPPLFVAGALALLLASMTLAGPAQAQGIPQQGYGPYRGQVIVDTSVLDQLGHDPYARNAPITPTYGPTTYGRAPAPPAATPRRPAVGKLLPPPGPGELAKRQAQINAAVRQTSKAAAKPASKPVAAKPAAPKPEAPPPVAEAKPTPPPAPAPAKPAAAPKPAETASAPPPPPPPPPPPKPSPAAAPAYVPSPPVAATMPEPPKPEPAPAASAAPPRVAPSAPALPPIPAASPAPAPAAAPAPAVVPPAPVAVAPAAPEPVAAPPVQTRVRVPPSAPAPVAAPPSPPPAQLATAPAPAAAPPPRPEPVAVPVAAPVPPGPAASGNAAARVTFVAGSSEMPEAAKAGLKAIADRMNRDAEMRVQLMAYAGPREDTASQARRLSLFRALAVRSYLIEQGVRSTRMDVRALGNKYEEEPADRVDVVIADR